MRKFLLIAIGLAAVLTLAVEIEPRIDLRDLMYFGGSPVTDTILAQNDTIYTDWIVSLGDMSEGTLLWATSGGSTGSVDSFILEIQQSSFPNWSQTAPDTTYLQAWDSASVVVRTDTISSFYLANLMPDGWIPHRWTRFRICHPFDADSLIINKLKVYMAGSK